MGVVKVYVHYFLSRHWIEWSSSHPGRFTSGVTSPSTLWIRSWTSPRTDLIISERENSLTLAGTRTTIPRSPNQ
jgi:hypothetical protein